jgi:hypothetical protein
MYRVLKYACVSLYARSIVAQKKRKEKKRKEKKSKEKKRRAKQRKDDPDFLQHCFLQQSRAIPYHLPHRSYKFQSLVFVTHLRMQVAILMQALSMT